MPYLITGVWLLDRPPATNRAQHEALARLDDWEEDTLETFSAALEAASRAFAMTLEAVVDDGEWLKRYQLRSTRGRKATMTCIGTLPAPKSLPPVLDGIKLGFPRSIAKAIDDHRARGGSTAELMAWLWRHIARRKKIAAADLERVLAPHAREPVVAKRYFVGDPLRARMKGDAEQLGLKVSTLLAYACAKYGRRRLRLGPSRRAHR